ncbi:MAG: ADP-glyceromanno-heptose 6-epimerase [Lachnospiraceae bacterium]|nr:ADP-glyceromanno-heptose 6-epimerase [Lachnospiraceae bacterium]
MSIILTGGAGFIGSCVLHMLNSKGIEDIIVVDNIGSTDKWRNLSNKVYTEYYNKEGFLEKLPDLRGKVSHIIHMGACSSTTEKNFDYLYENNYLYTRRLWEFAAENNCSFIYASSAATYGAGQNGFDDQQCISKLRPLNGYGYSKHLFDLWLEKQKCSPKQCVGLKFFNVYGPNEYHKGTMASVIFHAFNQINSIGKVELFKSYNVNYKDGWQLRDFIYVKDICKVISFMMDNPEINGLYNLGTGKAESFFTLASSVFEALGLETNIEYIDMPEYLRPKYQYFTEASMEKLRLAGYKEEFYSLRDGAKDYVRNYLDKNMEIY